MLSMRLLLCCVVILSLPAFAKAELLKGTGTWSTNVTGQGYTNQVFTGSTQFIVDTGSLTGVGFETLEGPLTSFSQSPSIIGTTVFDTSNTGYFMFFLDGAVYQVNIGGGSGSQVAGVNSSQDDFHLKDWVIGTDSFSLTVATESGFLSDLPVTSNFSFETYLPAPEPSTFTLAALGFLALVKKRRQRR